MTRLLTGLAFLLASYSAQAQQPAQIVSLSLDEHAETYFESLASEVGCGIWNIGIARGDLAILLDRSARYSFVEGDAKRADVPVTLAVDVNAWRRAGPDDFEPGPMNAVLGAVGLADARTIRLIVKDGTDLLAMWDRRKDDGIERHAVVARLDPSRSDSTHERWVLQGVGLDWCIRAASRITIELNDDESTETSWQRYGRYIRARSTLVSSLSRATERLSLCVTEGLRYAFVLEFDRSIKLGSLQRAADRLVVENGSWESQGQWISRVMPRVRVRGVELAPAVCIGRVGEKSIVVAALSTEDAHAVVESLSLSDAE